MNLNWQPQLRQNASFSYHCIHCSCIYYLQPIDETVVTPSTNCLERRTDLVNAANIWITHWEFVWVTPLQKSLPSVFLPIWNWNIKVCFFPKNVSNKSCWMTAKTSPWSFSRRPHRAVIGSDTAGTPQFRSLTTPFSQLLSSKLLRPHCKNMTVVWSSGG